MRKKIISMVTTLLLTVAVVVTMFFLCSHPSSQDINHSKLEGTPTLLDSIKSIKEWQLLQVDATTDIDSSRVRLEGLFHDYIKRRYYGSMSLGINLSNVTTNWHYESHDTITLNLPDIVLLDDNFIDESRTTLIQSDSRTFEADNKVRGAMYQRARSRLMQMGLSEQNKQQARKKAEDELSRLFKNIGYNVVKVNFK